MAQRDFQSVLVVFRAMAVAGSPGFSWKFNKLLGNDRQASLTRVHSPILINSCKGSVRCVCVGRTCLRQCSHCDWTVPHQPVTGLYHFRLLLGFLDECCSFKKKKIPSNRTLGCLRKGYSLAIWHSSCLCAGNSFYWDPCSFPSCSQKCYSPDRFTSFNKPEHVLFKILHWYSVALELEAVHMVFLSTLLSKCRSA